MMNILIRKKKGSRTERENDSPSEEDDALMMRNAVSG
jgi:hypothetical protein